MRSRFYSSFEISRRLAVGVSIDLHGWRPLPDVLQHKRLSQRDGIGERGGQPQRAVARLRVALSGLQSIAVPEQGPRDQGGDIGGNADGLDDQRIVVPVTNRISKPRR